MKKKKSTLKAKLKSKITSKNKKTTKRDKKKERKVEVDNNSSSSSSSSEVSRRVSASRSCVEEVKKSAVSYLPVALPNSKERYEMLGFMTVPHPESFLKNVLVDERPDLTFSENLTDSVADCLDKHLKDHAELCKGDEFMIEEKDNTTIQYEIRAKYNEGRYSALYLVFRTVWKLGKQVESGKVCMMKTQLRKGSARINLLIKREHAVIKAVQNKKKRFCPAIVDYGKVTDMPFIVMKLLDFNIDKYRDRIGGQLSFTTAIYVAKEALAALDEVHAKKYIHRDIKPANLAFGTEKDASKIFLLDFGDAVKSGKTIRLGVPDGHTLPYWSLDCHRRQKVSRKTDIESWFYVLIELTQIQVENSAGLPWKSILNVDEVAKAKENFWKDYQSLLSEPWAVKLAEMVATADLGPKAYAKMNTLLTEQMDSRLNGEKFTPDWILKKN